MGLESTTYINGLVATNPTGSDDRSQGDDHIRLIKAAILNTLPSLAGAMTCTESELNILDGATLSTSELNILDGVTTTTAELNFVDGVTSAIQAQLDAKAPLTGAGVSGTWAINISGNAVSANSASSATNATVAASCSGNAATATVAASCSGNASSATNATVAASCSGNAATATVAASCSGNAATATSATTATTAGTVTANVMTLPGVTIASDPGGTPTLAHGAVALYY